MDLLAHNHNDAGPTDMREVVRRMFGGRRLGLLFILVLLLLWDLSARTGLITSSNWPPVSAILVAAVRNLGEGELISALGGSLYRMTAGFVLGAIAAITLGTLLSVSRLARATVEPTIA